MQDTMNESRLYRGVLHCLSHVVATDGVRGLYRGLGVALIRGFPVNSVMLTVNHYVKQLV
jgi:hypothetical protein